MYISFDSLVPRQKYSKRFENKYLYIPRKTHLEDGNSKFLFSVVTLMGVLVLLTKSLLYVLFLKKCVLVMVSLRIRLFSVRKKRYRCQIIEVCFVSLNLKQLHQYKHIRFSASFGFYPSFNFVF